MEPPGSAPPDLLRIRVREAYRWTEDRLPRQRPPTAGPVGHEPGGAPLRVALAQLNTVVGDIEGNADRIAGALADAAEAGADVTLVPELAITGYPPEDLLLRPAFAASARAALDRVAEGVRNGLAIIGFPDWQGDCYNAAAVVADGRDQAVTREDL